VLIVVKWRPTRHYAYRHRRHHIKKVKHLSEPDLMYGLGLSLRVPTLASLEENPSQYRGIRDVGAVVNAQEEAYWTTTFLAPDRPIMAMDLYEGGSS
jgi:hypothetical protein